MDLRAPRTQPTTQAPDILDLAHATRELDRLSQELCGMVEQVGDARQIVEFNGERTKSALSRWVMKAFKEGADSSAKAEHSARASVGFEEELRELGRQYASAETVRFRAESLKIRIEALRSRISATKAAIEAQ